MHAFRLNLLDFKLRCRTQVRNFCKLESVRLHTWTLTWQTTKELMETAYLLIFDVIENIFLFAAFWNGTEVVPIWLFQPFTYLALPPMFQLLPLRRSKKF
jgi:hypothetical protein